MPNAFNREQARRDLELLLRGLSYYREWRILALEQTRPDLSKKEIENEVVMPAAMWMAIFDSTKGSRCTQVTDDVRQWYSNAIAELLQIRRSSNEASVAVDNFLQRFEAEVGYRFQSQGSLVLKIAKTVLERSRITTEKQYYILKETEVDLSSGLLTDEEASQILTLLRSFEERQQRR